MYVTSDFHTLSKRSKSTYISNGSKLRNCERKGVAGVTVSCFGVLSKSNAADLLMPKWERNHNSRISRRVRDQTNAKSYHPMKLI